MKVVSYFVRVPYSEAASFKIKLDILAEGEEI